MNIVSYIHINACSVSTAEKNRYKHSFIIIIFLGKDSIITCVYFFLILFLIDLFFDVDSKSTIGFRRSHVVFKL